MVKDNHIRKENSIYPGGFNLKFNNGERGKIHRLVKYMRDFINKRNKGINQLKSGNFQLSFYGLVGSITYKTSKTKQDLR